MFRKPPRDVSITWCIPPVIQTCLQNGCFDSLGQYIEAANTSHQTNRSITNIVTGRFPIFGPWRTTT